MEQAANGGKGRQKREKLQEIAKNIPSTSGPLNAGREETEENESWRSRARHGHHRPEPRGLPDDNHTRTRKRAIYYIYLLPCGKPQNASELKVLSITVAYK